MGIDNGLFDYRSSWIRVDFTCKQKRIKNSSMMGGITTPPVFFGEPAKPRVMELSEVP